MNSWVNTICVFTLQVESVNSKCAASARAVYTRWLQTEIKQFKNETHNHLHLKELQTKKYKNNFVLICIDANREENPTRWWKSYYTQLPLLSTMAHMHTPATSVPSERAFSTVGNIVNVKHSCLLPENTNMLTFLAQNLD